MGFSIAELFQVSLLCLNALAILSERRFLAKYGLATAIYPNDQAGEASGNAFLAGGQPFGENFGNFGVSSPANSANNSPMKAQIASLLASVRMLMRWPLIFLNMITIVFALIFG
jgi:hypothetical protein